MTEVRQTHRRFAYLRALLAGSAACCALSAGPLAAAVTDFQLPPSTRQTPAAQGPVDEGAPPPRAVAPAPTPTPTPRATAPTPSPTPARILTPAPVRTATPTPTPRPTATPARPTPTPTASVAPAPTATPSAAASPEPLPTAAPEPIAPVSLPEPEPEPVAAAETEGGFAWYWLALSVLLVLAAGAAIALFLRRRRGVEPELAVPAIERPRVPPPPQPEQQALPLEPDPLPPAAPPTPTPAAMAEQHDGPLSIAIEARQLSISLTAATLAYRVTLTNTARTSLRDITISGDMISAHSSIPEEDQVASTGIALEERHRIERIPAGETTQLTGEFRLPFTSIRPIRKGGAALFVPLARLKAEVAVGGNGPVVQTALVGQRAERAGGGLLPFRLDLGPRIYREVTQRIFS
jgi:hypothetical protein